VVNYAEHTHADSLKQMVSDGKTRSGKPYNNEYMYTFRFNAEGKILSIQEFLDSRYVLDILAGEKDAA
jgi:ketosteroid isomerase-like protein